MKIYADKRAPKLFYYWSQRIHDKRAKIAGYLIYHIDKRTNRISFKRYNLANKFHCSVSTVNKAIKLIKDIDYYNVYSNHITINYKQWNKDVDNAKRKGDIQID